jgi:hypothetical protein
MKKIIILLLLSIACSIEFVSSQTTVSSLSYSYDAAGNMTARTIVFPVNSLKEKIENDSINGKENKEQPFFDEINERKIQLWPNPTKGLLKVEVENKQPGDNLNIEVYNTSGTRLFEQSLSGSNGEIDLSVYANGTYFLVLNINGQSRNWTIIKK